MSLYSLPSRGIQVGDRISIRPWMYDPVYVAIDNDENDIALINPVQGTLVNIIRAPSRMNVEEGIKGNLFLYNSDPGVYEDRLGIGGNVSIGLMSWDRMLLEGEEVIIEVTHVPS